MICSIHFAVNPFCGVYPSIVDGHVIVTPCGLVIKSFELQVGHVNVPGVQAGLFCESKTGTLFMLKHRGLPSRQNGS